MIGKKLGEEDNSQQGQNKLIWDGTEETRDMITRAVQNKVTLGTGNLIFWRKF